MFKDSFKRNIDYLRISLTDRCNLRCVYCMPEEGVESLAHADILSFEEIERLVGLLASRGISKIKLTGGEPLVRKDTTHLVKSLKSIVGIDQVTLTTNALLLEKSAKKLLDAGIDGVNVSLDTMNPKTFRAITKFDGFERVISGIDTAYDLGIPLKINFVAIKGLNEEDIPKIALLARDKDINVRYIELMPLGLGRGHKMVDNHEIKHILTQSYGELTAFEKTLGNGPASYFELEDFVGKIGFISALSHEFCRDCNRIRLTSDGKIKPCLYSDSAIDIKAVLRSKGSDDEIIKTFADAVSRKVERHSFDQGKRKANQESREMYKIGG